MDTAKSETESAIPPCADTGASGRAARRVRLPGPKKMLARVLQRLEVLIEKGEISKNKLADCLIRQSEIALVLYKEQQSTQRRRLIEANTRLEAEVAELRSTAPAPVDLELADFMAYHAGKSPS